jgi:hypothetical protein
MINWKYFFGMSGNRTFNRCYKAEIKGVRVEKHASNQGVTYSIGNIDKANTKYKTEDDLIKAVNANTRNDCFNCQGCGCTVCDGFGTI